MKINVVIFSILLLLTSCGSQSSAIEMPTTAIMLDGEGPLNNLTPSPSENANKTSNPSPTSNPLDPDAEIEIEDQVGDGRSLNIDEVEFSLNHVWLVIRSKNGEIFHTELLSYGVKKVSLQLDKALQTGEYLVSLHSDNGDKVFDENLDLLIRGHENEMAREDFEYTRTN